MKIPVLLTFFLILLLLFGYELHAQITSSSTLARIDSVFSQWNNQQSPGAVIGVIHRGKFLYKQAYGMADVERKEKLTTEHAFWVASVAKQFTAMSIALLAEAGKLTVEDDIRKYLPELPFMGDTIRIKHLIYHTSGLRDGFTLIGMRFKGEKQYTNDQIFQIFTRQRELNFKPGERYEYNNSGYVLLANIVERVSGKSFDDFTHKHIFQPLAMTRTCFHGSINKEIPQLAHGYAVKYKSRGVRYQKGHFKGNTTGSTGLVTTLEDLYKWDQNFYANTLGKTAELIKTITTNGRLNNGAQFSYAFGLEVESYKNQTTFTHSGSDKGYKAEIVRFPDLQLTIIGLTNADNLYSLTHKLLRIGEWILPEVFENDSIESYQQSINRTELKSRTGYYINPDNLADLRVVTEKNSTLYAARSIKGYQEALIYSAPHTFVNDGTGEYTYHFTIPEEGYREQLNYKERANAYTLHKIQPDSLTQDELKLYTGTYYSPALDKNYHLSIRKGKLGLRIFHLIHIPFQPMENKLFLADLIGNNSI